MSKNENIYYFKTLENESTPKNKLYSLDEHKDSNKASTLDINCNGKNIDINNTYYTIINSIDSELNNAYKDKSYKDIKKFIDDYCSFENKEYNCNDLHCFFTQSLDINNTLFCNIVYLNNKLKTINNTSNVKETKIKYNKLFNNKVYSIHNIEESNNIKTVNYNIFNYDKNIQSLLNIYLFKLKNIVYYLEIANTKKLLIIAKYINKEKCFKFYYNYKCIIEFIIDDLIHNYSNNDVINYLLDNILKFKGYKNLSNISNTKYSDSSIYSKFKSNIIKTFNSVK